MFIFTCQIFARQLVFPVPQDNNWPLQKTALGCAPWQTTTDPSKSLTEVMLSWIAFLNGPIRWEDGNAALFCVDMVTCWIFTLSARISVIYPPSIPKEYNLSLLHQCPGQFPSHFSHLPISISKEYILPKLKCPCQLTCEWATGMVMAPCWAFSYFCSTF